MKVRDFRYFVGDFETTTFDGQEFTEVWASASVELYTDNVNIFHSIDEQFNYFFSLQSDIIVYYHNLKFDGAFWLHFLINKLGFKQAYTQYSDTEIVFHKDKEMKNRTFKYLISEMGQWYSIVIKINNVFIKIYDSLKLLPFSVKRIGDSFGTKHKKSAIEYTGFRYAGCEITDEERNYIANDVLVVKEALEIMFDEGHNSLTIGSCCLKEYRKIIGYNKFNALFPDLTEFEIDKNIYRQRNADGFIRKSYKGGWCYLVKEKSNKILENGVTADVNSLYPSVMSGESGNKYPIGVPTFWVGNIPEEAKATNRYYFVRIRTRFKLKEGYLPCIQIKDNLFYQPTEWLKTSDIYDAKNDIYFETYTDFDGVEKKAVVELTLTCTDFELIKEHYNLYDTEFIGGCYFEAITGLFDDYIEKYKNQKLTTKGAKKESAKLFLNNLYGKLASNSDSSFKIAFIKDDGALGYRYINANDKKTVSIACGSAVTSYARNFTIRTAQKNYKYFVYADTDSIHCTCKPEQIKGIKVHDKNFLCWKLESSWDKAIFVRQKTYIEHNIAENLEECKPYYNIKCAGMPQRCKDLLNASFTGEEIEIKTDDEKEFLKTKRTLKDFKKGLVVPSKLRAKNIKGGIVLVNTSFEIR